MPFCLLLLVLTAFPASVLAQAQVSGQLAGVVFADADGDGRRAPGEAGIAGVVVCSRSECAATDDDGTYDVQVEPGYRVVWVRQPDGYRAVRGFWRRVPADPFEWLVSFPLEESAPLPVRAFSFIHASDTHLDEESLPRFRRLREITEERGVDFVLITGDLIKDALRVPEETARERFELFRKEKSDFPVPVWVVPGNHENFGIERELSGVSEDNPLYGKAMYRRFLGPTYYSFDYGGVHFVALDTVDIEGQWYYAHVDATQMSWLDEDLSTVAADTPVVTFNHIPLFSAVIHGWNFYPDGGKRHRDRRQRAVPPHGLELRRHPRAFRRAELSPRTGRPRPRPRGDSARRPPFYDPFPPDFGRRGGCRREGGDGVCLRRDPLQFS